MKKLDPVVLFERLAADIPRNLHADLFVTGNLAAAYHFQAQLEGRAISTKDADLVVHPAGNVTSCQEMAGRLITLGWICTEECYPRPNPDPADELRAIRLYPPGSHDYFLEFLNLPEQGQKKPKVGFRFGWMTVGMGCRRFVFFGVTSLNRLKSNVGLEYASPSMMALANLLSHPEIGTARIESGQMDGPLACCERPRTSHRLGEAGGS